MNNNLNNKTINTWCLGCGNFSILNAMKSVILSLVEKGMPLENFVLVSGIGCHGKIVDYIKINSFYSLHGRAIPAAEGIKLANKNLKVIVFAGDGDAYGEGIEHLIFAAKRNIDITTIIHNNRLYGLTTGQYSPTSFEGFKGRSTPYGTHETPINPLEIMLSSKASFIARATSHGIEFLKKIFEEAILHKGFSVVDVLQVCVTYLDLYKYYNDNVYPLSDHNPEDYLSALNKIREWNYSEDKKIALGVFYKKQLPCFEGKYSGIEEKNINIQQNIKDVLKDKK
jgi:2-oxoglutarate/2-oxoacid ferredoxin oxidoreductase subunit beta